MSLMSDAHFISHTETTEHRLSRALTGPERELLLSCCGLSDVHYGPWVRPVLHSLAALSLIMAFNDRTPTALGRKVAGLLL